MLAIAGVLLAVRANFDPAIGPARLIFGFEAVIIGPGSFFTSILPPLHVKGVRAALASVRGPVILITNLLTEGRGMSGFTAADAARWVSRAIDRPVDVVIETGIGQKPAGYVNGETSSAVFSKPPRSLGQSTTEPN